MAAARTAALTELGRALGCSDGTSSESAPRAGHALPARLFYTGPFEPRPPRRPLVSLGTPTHLDREAWELARRGDEDRLRFILTRARGRKARRHESQPAPLQHDPLASLTESSDARIREILATIPGGSWKS
jgi:hypothetical protein